MSSQPVPPASPGEDGDVPEDVREAALIAAVIRAQERHREGGVQEPEPGDAGEEPEPDR